MRPAEQAHANGRPPLAVVTGASSGIGYHVALHLAQRGYRTALVARREDRLCELAQRLNGSAACEVIAADLADPAGVETATGRLAALGPVGVLVNNAGFGVFKPFLEHSHDEHRLLMQVNYFAPVRLIAALLPGMLAAGRGHVINIASISVKMGPFGHAGYTASKSALVSLTQTLAADYAGSGVNFSYVNPGIVLTDYFNEPSYAALRDSVRHRAVPVEDTARRIVSLLDRPRLELCIPGHYRLLDWVRAVSPDWAHRMVLANSRPDSAAPDTQRPGPAPAGGHNGD